MGKFCFWEGFCYFIFFVCVIFVLQQFLGSVSGYWVFFRVEMGFLDWEFRGDCLFFVIFGDFLLEWKSCVLKEGSWVVKGCVVFSWWVEVQKGGFEIVFGIFVGFEEYKEFCV